jgi:hypothetical protein
MTNPYSKIKLFLRWEIYELNAILEAINIKAAMEAKRSKKIQKKEQDKRSL